MEEVGDSGNHVCGRVCGHGTGVAEKEGRRCGEGPSAKRRGMTVKDWRNDWEWCWVWVWGHLG